MQPENVEKIIAEANAIKVKAKGKLGNTITGIDILAYHAYLHDLVEASNNVAIAYIPSWHLAIKTFLDLIRKDFSKNVNLNQNELIQLEQIADQYYALLIKFGHKPFIGK